MIIAVDFDGTCVTHDYPEIGKDIGAASVLRKLVDSGHQLILYTMRSDTEERKCLTEAVDWFRQNNIPLYGVQFNPTQKEWTTSNKCYAQLYIDDAAFGAPLIRVANSRPYLNWGKVENELLPNSEQEDKRSVASKDDSSTSANTNKSYSELENKLKEKEDEIAKLNRFLSDKYRKQAEDHLQSIEQKKIQQLQSSLDKYKALVQELFGVMKVVFYSTVKPDENPIAEWDKFLERNNYKENYNPLKQQL